MDAQFVIESTNEIQRGLAIKGTLLQKLVNLSLPDYRVFYSQLRNGLLYNFTLSNTFGSVSW
jgi:phage tail protein X